MKFASENLPFDLERQVLSDFCKVINQQNDDLTELALASPGTSRFNRAIYFDRLAPEDIYNFKDKKLNVSFFSGLNKEMPLGVPLGKETKRSGADRFAKRKNIISFDMDFKDNESIDPSKAQLEVGNELLKRLKSHECNPWLLVFSGHGFHLHFKFDSPIEINSIQNYQKIYNCCRLYLQCVIGYKLDPTCSNPSRLFRLPFSTNWKELSNPIPCKIIHHEQNSSFYPLWKGFSAFNNINLNGSGRFTGEKGEILAKLDLLKVLSHFGYKKTTSFKQGEENIVCSSPFRPDSTPSFYYDRNRKIFYDFSCSQGGDLFTLVSMLAKLNLSKEFPKVLEICAGIAGIETQAQDIGYTVDEKGVWYHSTKDAKPIWLSSPIYVEALTRDYASKSWGRLLMFKDQDEVLKSWAMPMELLAGDGLDIRKTLLNLGVELAMGKRERQLHIAYLQSAKPERRARCVNRVGWHQGSYVTPDKIFSSHSAKDRIILQTALVNGHFGISGTLEDWQKHIGAYCSGNSRLIFAVCTALAAPNIYLTGEESGGFHLVGPSSIGKSISLKIAASVWGNPGLNGFIRRWRSTLNGLELLAASRCDSLLILDELGEVDPKDAGAAAYVLGSGQSKTRATRKAVIADNYEWRLLFLSSGETSLCSHISQSGSQTFAGQEIRMIDLPAQASEQLGVFEYLHGKDTSANFASMISENAERFFGAPIVSYLEKLVDNPAIPEKMAFYQQEFNKRIDSECSHGQVDRVRKRFALVAGAGELATELGVLPWDKGEATDAVKTMFLEWKSGWSINGSRETQQLMQRIRSLLQEFGPSRFPLLSEIESYRNNHNQPLWGFRKPKDDGTYDWIILNEVFRKQLCKGLDHRKAVKDLLQLGFISGPAKPMRLPHIGVTRVIGLLGTIIES